MILLKKMPHLGPVLTIFSIITLVYANSLQTPFVFDDLGSIYLSPSRQMTSISISTLWDAAFEGLKTRWVANLSFAFNYYFHRHDVWGYHFFNIAMHISAALSFYCLSFITLKMPGLSYNTKTAGKIAFGAALLWAVHPLQTNATTYIVQRMTSMAAFFSFISIIFYIKGRAADHLPVKFVFFFSCLFAAALALCSKENSAILPLIFLMYEVFFITDNHEFFTKKRAIQMIASLFGIFALAWFYSGGNLYDLLLKSYELRDFTLFERLLTQTRVLFLYLSLLLLPLPTRLNLSHDFAISSGFFSPPVTFLAILALLGFIFLGFYLFKRQKLISFGILWLLATLLIESSVIPLELVFEHRMYVPSSMLILATVAFIYHYLTESTARVLLVSMVIILAVFTWQRNETWATEISLWSDVVEKSPNLGRGYDFLGRAYLAGGNPQKAYAVFKEANSRKVKPVYFNNWGQTAFELGKKEEAIGYFKEAIRLKPDHAQAHYNLGIAYGSIGLRDKARQEMVIGMSLGSK